MCVRDKSTINWPFSSHLLPQIQCCEIVIGCICNNRNKKKIHSKFQTIQTPSTVSSIERDVLILRAGLENIFLFLTAKSKNKHSLSKGHVTRCNFSCNLRCNSTRERCQLVKSVKNFRYVEKTSAECNEDSYLVILHLSRVELHCKLRGKLHRVTWP
jgi:hypothetical protein